MEHSTFIKLVQDFVDAYNANESVDYRRINVHFDKSYAELTPQKYNSFWSPEKIYVFVEKNDLFTTIEANAIDRKPCIVLFHL